MHAYAACVILSFVVDCNNGPRNGRTGDAIVDSCLHWTACMTPPISGTNIEFPDCATCARGQSLPRRNVGVAITPSERDCLADAGLDCAAALDCEDDVYIPRPDLSANVADMAPPACNIDGGLGRL